MFIKFCETKYNLAKDSSTIGLGTLQSYADDDPEFFRFDFQEGHFIIKNNGEEVHIDGPAFERLSGGAVQSTGGAFLERGSQFNRYFQFPNCYVFCFSQNVVPSVQIAQKIDKAYDDWYAINDVQKFIQQIAGLLMNQLRVSDFEKSKDISLEWLRGLNLQVVHRACTYDGRELHFDQTSVRQAVHASEDMFRWPFSKEHEHGEFKEYRILFVLRDAQGQIVEVKKSSKILKLLPDLGVSTIEVTIGG